MIHQTKRSVERILGFGTGGVGKSYAALCIAKQLPSGRTMWIIETDPAYDRLLEDPEFEDLGVREEYAWDTEVKRFDNDDTFIQAGSRIVMYHARSWPAIRAAIEEVWDRAKRGDWVVIDNITSPWEKVQEWYWHEVFGQEMDEYLINIRRMAMEGTDDGEKATGTVTEEKFSEWSFINPHYAKHFTDKVLNPPCHLYLTAEQTQYVSHFDAKNKELNIYASLGYKPKGQKKSPHITHTVLHFDHPSHGYTLKTVKDRSRDELDRELWDDFAIDYLVTVGGWHEGDVAPEVAEAQPKPRPRRRSA